MKLNAAWLVAKIALGSAVCSFALVMQLGLELENAFNAWILGGLAVVFSFSELYFRQLLSDITAINRDQSLTVTEHAKLRSKLGDVQVKANVLWPLVVVCKALAVIVAGSVSAGKLQGKQLEIGLWLGYTTTFACAFTMAWSFIRYRECEAFRDSLAGEVREKKEKARLGAKSSAGSSHDFKKDPELNAYHQEV